MRAIAGMALLAVVAASPVLAQAQGATAPTRQGFTFSLGLGGGSAAIQCDGCDSDRENGLSGYLRMGGALRPNLIIGGETHGYTKTETEGADELKATISYISAYAQFYPQPTNGFFVKGGLGLGMINFDLSGTINAEMKSTAAALTMGAGYDWRLAPNFSLTPYANFLFMAKGDAKVDGTSSGEKLGSNVLQLGLGVTWH